MPDTQDLKRKYLQDTPNPAADLVRQKLKVLYNSEPDAVDEAVESTLVAHPSKHQKFMNELSSSGKPIAEVQTAWHDYYQGLNNKEKHEVWQEFYATREQQSALFKSNNPSVLPAQQNTPALDIPMVPVNSGAPRQVPKADDNGHSVAELKRQLVSKVRVRGKLSRKQHLKSLGFGLASGALVVLILLFGFFNDRFIAPFITPSRTVSATPLILDANSTAVDPSPQIIIPKINVQGPVVYDVPTIADADVEAGLERGVVHYVTTPNPGEQGNAVFFGHSSGNILNSGKFKFVFVLLSWLDNGDTFYIQKGGVRYVYKVVEKKIVSPSDISVLDPIPGKTATATLITCDPPGTNVNRLIIVGEQISPDPSTNAASTAKAAPATPKVLAGNSESLWHRITSAIF